MVKEKPQNLVELIQGGFIYPAWLPDKNDFLFNEEGRNKILKIVKESSGEFPKDISLLNLGNLKNIKGYLAFLTEKDYGALSPLMWNTFFERQRLNYRAIYFVGNPEDAEIIVNALKSDPKYVGGGFGSGWKEQHSYLDRIFPKELKSVNFIAKNPKTKELIGYNTDIEGMLLPLEERFRQLSKGGIQGKTIVMFGAGGVGKELPRHLVQRGVGKLIILNRTVEKAERLAEEANKIRQGVAEYGGEEQIRECLLKNKVDAVVNVTKKGAEPFENYAAFAKADIDDPEGVRRNNEESLKIAKGLAKINPEIIIYDITLPKAGKPKTLEIAEQAGLEHLVRGIGMVTNQGVIAAEKLYKRNPKMFENKYDKKTIEQVFKEVNKG